MSPPPANPSAQEQIVGELTWRWAVRADLLVARHLVGGEDPDSVYGIGVATVVDRLFCWLGDIGVLAELEAMDGVGIERRTIPFETWVMLYFLRCLARCPSQNSLPDTLFSDTSLMRRLGFNAHQIEFGITARGGESRKGERLSCPLDPEALSKNIVKLPLDDVRAVFQECLCLVWDQLKSVPKRLLAAIDGSFIEIGPTAEGAGVSSREKQVRTKEGMKTVKSTVVGFKMMVLYVPSLGLPLAVAFGPANLDERTYVRQLLLDAQEVIGDRATLDTVVIDRGFISGPGLWEIHDMGLRFVIPARRDLKVHEEARGLVHGQTEEIPTYRSQRQRVRRRRPKDGGRPVAVTETLEVVGVEGCRTFETYATAAEIGKSGHKDRHKKSFEANPINAVVLTREDGREHVDLVLLTNGPVKRPFVPFDDYDDRSRIENEINRELQQHWFIERPPQRTAKAAELHVLFVMLAFAMTQGFRLWEEQQLAEDEVKGTSTLGEYVRGLQRENHDRVVVFLDDQYGIFYTSDIILMFGRRVRDPAPGAARTLEELMLRLEGCLPDA